MPIERMYSPKYWRMRAEEFRTKAGNAEHSQTKESLLKVAQNYEELARRAEKIHTVRDEVTVRTRA
ncbi:MULTISPECIES: hypothetical protein [unclassified Bradyrhizobium]|uniref:hypothetical protein n=1 Tax=unclassified Bradyrhizobium TaxID=2631580 RepID=UPI002478FC14|nr:MULTISPECIES: hypothetical protein [unclassified Bradyrhizobium]WGR73195.1 hypothetical protein MTX24_10345 [Bradyrhizobium sp. ISRA426]WGR78034.1 hypothetical protein MTX21_35315 [Bradyrhizobium sp. ISRA430]WGR88435.1 hypothetical protein MTX25_10355 [Bradyrhizobium sp. ISRA432]